VEKEDKTVPSILVLLYWLLTYTRPKYVLSNGRRVFGYRQRWKMWLAFVHLISTLDRYKLIITIIFMHLAQYDILTSSLLNLDYDFCFIVSRVRK